MDLPTLELHCGGLFIMGVRTTWHTESDGEFYCAACGGDRNYLRRSGVRRLTVLNVPLLHRGTVAAVAECGTCHERYDLDALELPTSGRFSAMLREAAHAVALAVLSAGGAAARPVREAALETVREAGGADCADDRLAGLLAALDADGDRPPDAGPGGGEDGPAGPDDLDAVCEARLAIELHEALEPLTCHLAPQGREHILLQGARIALADGPYLPAEREVLAAVGHCLGLPREDTARLLEAATGTPS
ncbi:TerB family tellurite resistance protein [Streptomyces sp. SL13]|uniref:TerB family tellurite resistance protein n=1 Tax=Streptantibioticus silvisoli TaxID=2705255 RepID=A0AA90GZC8_9ACTN|nr:TerB family tellurite resistance protein [Streptantibioticus silvisoli]MDI5961446.1 TerB family tellurite resistance protein [Streptantibioticus silvisoli]MDI5968029.1 TerB family tellurite resistance protein [Streptantibioticus silvisoli]